MERLRLEADGGTFELLGVCEGLVREEDQVSQVVRSARPDVVALALDGQLVPHLEAWSQSEHLEREDELYAEGLRAWGKVTLPPGVYGAALRAGQRVGARVIGVDLDEGVYLDLYTERISMWQLFKRTFWLSRVGKRPPRAKTPEAFCRAFDARVNRGPFALLEQRREAAMAEGMAEAGQAGQAAHVVAVVPVARLQGVSQALRDRLAVPGRSGRS